MSSETKRPRITLDVNENLIPDELAALDRWLNWKPKWDAAKGRWDKLPVDGLTDRKIDRTKPGNLNPLAQVLEAQERARTCFQEMMKLSREERQYVPLYGVGFGLAKGLPGLDRLKGVDLDHCINGAGRVAQWAQEIVDALRTYTEYSPSGTGLRLFVKGDLPEGYKHKVTGLGPDRRGVLEVYEEGRFLTITGDVCCPSSDTEEIDLDYEEIDLSTPLPYITFRVQERDLSCLAQYVAPRSAQSGDTHRGGEKEEAGDVATLPDNVIINLLCTHPLWGGDTSEHNGDDSAADLALCNLIAQHTDSPEQVDRIFRQSGLMREKWERTDYRERTIKKGLEGAPVMDGRQTTETENQSPKESKIRQRQPVDWGDSLMVKTLKEPRWAIEGLIPEGITILAGTKSVGKSWFALNLAIAISEGGKALGKIPVEQGKVLYLALEDGQRRTQSRLHKLLNTTTAHPAAKSIAFRYEVPPLGRGLFDELGWWMDDYPDTRLIVVDLLVDIFGPTEEKKSGYFATYKTLGTLRRTAEDLSVPMLLLHHTNMRTDDQLVDGFDRILGGQGIKGPVSECLLLDRERASATMTLMATGKDIEERVYNLQWDDAWRFHLLDERPKAALTHERMKILRAVGQGHQTPKDVGLFLGKGADSMRKTMERMVEAGQLQRIGYGKFGLV